MNITCRNLETFGQLIGDVGGQAQWKAEIICRHRYSGIAFTIASWYFLETETDRRVLWLFTLGIGIYGLRTPRDQMENENEKQQEAPESRRVD